MKRIPFLMTAAASFALVACGTHSNPAPVVFGTQPASTGRVYNSKADFYRQYPAASQQTAQAAQPVQASYASGAPLKTAEIDRSELPPIAGAATPSRASYANRRAVVVARGDTVYAIARRTGSSPEAVIAANNLHAPYDLTIGETLTIPDPRAKIANDITEPRAEPVRIAANRPGAHVVRRGDTLYSVSRSTGVPVATLAEANNLHYPYTLDVGQQLRVPSGGGAPSPTLAAPAPSEDVGAIARNVSYTTTVKDPSHMFDWPVKGAVIGKFGSGSGGRRNDGVNIAAPVGTPVRAAADGEVVYRGSELEGYGNLLLVKHADGFVTAYAHNDVMLVDKGDIVHQGQVIAKVGQTGAASEPQLHFEIRHNLKSVDPLAMLQ